MALNPRGGPFFSYLSKSFNIRCVEKYVNISPTYGNVFGRVPKVCGVVISLEGVWYRPALPQVVGARDFVGDSVNVRVWNVRRLLVPKVLVAACHLLLGHVGIDARPTLHNPPVAANAGASFHPNARRRCFVVYFLRSCTVTRTSIFTTYPFVKKCRPRLPYNIRQIALCERKNGLVCTKCRVSRAEKTNFFPT